MVITTVSTPKEFRRRGRPQEDRMKIFDDPIRYSTFLQKIQSTADGGFEFRDKQWDEFDNGFEVIVQVSREDVEAIKEMIAKGLI